MGDGTMGHLSVRDGRGQDGFLIGRHGSRGLFTGFVSLDL